jgi:hypothetical protein
MIGDKKAFEDHWNYEKSKAQSQFYDYLELKDSLSLSSRKAYMKYLISVEKNFFDPYVELSDTYMLLGKEQRAHRLLGIAMKRLHTKTFNSQDFPLSMSYYNLNNRHIFRLLYSYANSSWLNGLKDQASTIFLKIIEMDNKDPLGARYPLLGIEKGFKSAYEMSSELGSSINEWFRRESKKYTQRYGIFKTFD